MVRVNFLKENKIVEVIKGTTILDAARCCGITIEAPCNGVGICGKCKVKIDNIQNVKIGSGHTLSENENSQGYVLACESRVYDDIGVVTSDSHKNKALKILDHGASFDIELDTYIKKGYQSKSDNTYVYSDIVIIGVEEGDTRSKNYGVVIDIGTTTLVASLVNLNEGREMASVSALNPQAIHAQDVLSRIKLATDEAGLKLLYTELLKQLNEMISNLAQENDIDKNNIYEVIFSGNTCMLHLACNVNPKSMGRYPYTPALKGGENIRAKEIGLDISKFGVVYLPPVISSYVGADITSGILASQLEKSKGVVLFVDIGTNGEMVLATDGVLTATSTAAGPAFEGMNITYGMRAGNGAIEYFDIDEDKGIEIRTIGDETPKGICGSGLLDIVGELVSSGVIDKNGKFVSPENLNEAYLRDKVLKEDKKAVFSLSEGVYLSQKDVRQVQLAKGAIRAGIEFLLRSKNIEAKDVDKVLIAGSFGYHLRAKSLINIGLLPKEFEGKIEFIGNTSKTGGNAFLLNKSYRDEMGNLVKDVEVIELANYKDFDKVFVKSLSF